MFPLIHLPTSLQHAQRLHPWLKKIVGLYENVSYDVQMGSSGRKRNNLQPLQHPGRPLQLARFAQLKPALPEAHLLQPGLQWPQAAHPGAAPLAMRARQLLAAAAPRLPPPPPECSPAGRSSPTSAPGLPASVQIW